MNRKFIQHNAHNFDLLYRLIHFITFTVFFSFVLYIFLIAPIELVVCAIKFINNANIVRLILHNFLSSIKFTCLFNILKVCFVSLFKSTNAYILTG